MNTGDARIPSCGSENAGILDGVSSKTGGGWVRNFFCSRNEAISAMSASGRDRVGVGIGALSLLEANVYKSGADGTEISGTVAAVSACRGLCFSACDCWRCQFLVASCIFHSVDFLLPCYKCCE